MFVYRLFGLRLCANRAIGDLWPEDETDRCDVRICFGERPDWWVRSNQSSWSIRFTNEVSGPGGNPLLVVRQLDQGEYLWFVYDDGTEFFIERSSGNIWTTWPEPFTQEDAVTYLLGPVLGFLLRLRGITCLHGSAFVVRNRALALVGPAQAGKSTTAAALAQRGFPVLSDDVLPVVAQQNAPYVQPGYPRLRLWQDSAALLFGESEQLPLITPNWDKRFLDLTADDYQFQQYPLPLGAIYLLEPRADTPSAPRIESLSPAEVVMALTANTYTNYLLDKAMRVQELDFLLWLVERVPVRRIIPHTDPGLLPGLCDHILDDYRHLETRDTVVNPITETHV